MWWACAGVSALRSVPAQGYLTIHDLTGGRQQANDRRPNGGFPGPALSNKAVNLARVNRKRYIFDRMRNPLSGFKLNRELANF